MGGHRSGLAVAVAVLVNVAFVLAGCAPATDLTHVPGNAGTAGPGGQGATSALLMDPSPGSTAVPLNLAAVVVRFPAAVTWGAESLHICKGEPALVPTSPAVEVPCDGGACYRFDLAGLLPAGVSCNVALAAGNRDGAGTELAPGIIGVFDTAAARDETPPALLDVTLAVSGPCLAVGFSTDEPATATVQVIAGSGELSTPAGVGLTRFDLAVALGALPPETAATVAITAVDRAGNVVSSSPLPFTTPVAVPPLAITEVLANAAGPEPAQEYVELRNLGQEALALAGLRIEDGKGGDDLPAEMLDPGAYALVVASGYEPAQGQDPAPRPGTLVVRVDTRIGSDGLSNASEPVRLTLAGAVVSSYGGWVDVSPARWSGKAVHRTIESACDRADAWNQMPLDPTPGAAPP
jgi:hypothetical protein